MNEYRPPIPLGDSAFAHWAKKIQQGAFGTRRLLTDPSSFTTQTPAGVFHRPKPSADEPDEQISHFHFCIRWKFPSGIPVDANTQPPVNIPDVDLVVSYNASIASDAEYNRALSDGETELSQWYGQPSILKLPYPINEGWVIDIGFAQVLEGFDDRIGPYVGPNEFLQVTISNHPESGRGASSDVMPARRFYSDTTTRGDTPSVYTPDKLRFVRYYPQPETEISETFIGLGLSRSNNRGVYSNRELMELNFPAGLGMVVVGHAFDLSGVPALFGNHGLGGTEAWMLA